MTWIADMLAWPCVLAGSFFLLAGGIGVLRLPDVYTRMHAAGMTDTMGAGMLLLGLILHEGLTLASAKLVLILLFLFFTSPVASFSLAHAGLTGGVQPVRTGQPAADPETREETAP